jgi:hypothetical protein
LKTDSQLSREIPKQTHGSHEPEEQGAKHTECNRKTQQRVHGVQHRVMIQIGSVVEAVDALHRRSKQKDQQHEDHSDFEKSA